MAKANPIKVRSWMQVRRRKILKVGQQKLLIYVHDWLFLKKDDINSCGSKNYGYMYYYFLRRMDYINKLELHIASK